MTDNDALRRQLLERLEVIQRRAGRIEAHRRNEAGTIEADFEEQATQRENDEVLDALDDASRHEVQGIRAALARLEAGNYGTCRSCGETIPAARLNAMPTATTCVGCAD